MAGFLTHLVQRTLTARPTLVPRLAGPFEGAQESSGAPTDAPIEDEAGDSQIGPARASRLVPSEHVDPSEGAVDKIDGLHPDGAFASPLHAFAKPLPVLAFGVPRNARHPASRAESQADLGARPGRPPREQDRLFYSGVGSAEESIPTVDPVHPTGVRPGFLAVVDGIDLPRRRSASAPEAISPAPLDSIGGRLDASTIAPAVPSVDPLQASHAHRPREGMLVEPPHVGFANANGSPIDTWSSPAPQASAPPTVHVTIGRIELRAATPAPTPKQHHAAAPRPALSLADYLERRNAGSTR